MPFYFNVIDCAFTFAMSIYDIFALSKRSIRSNQSSISSFLTYKNVAQELCIYSKKDTCKNRVKKLNVSFFQTNLTGFLFGMEDDPGVRKLLRLGDYRLGMKQDSFLARSAQNSVRMLMLLYALYLQKKTTVNFFS